MKEKDIVEVLGRLKGEADAPLHRTALRRALLAEPASTTRFVALHNLVTISYMKKYYIPLAAIALVAVGAATFNPGDPAVAQAQEQAQRSWARAVQISPEMRAELEAKMKADMLETLKEAMAAPDLRILTKEEFEKESPFTISRGPMMATTTLMPAGNLKVVKTVAFSHAGVAGQKVEGMSEGGTFTVRAVNPSEFKEVKDVMTVSAGFVAARGGEEFSEPVKYLSYTDPRGNKTVLGLDENDTPVFKFSQISASEIMHMEDGTIGIKAEGVKMINIQSAEMAE